MLTINGDNGGADVLNVDDTGDASVNTGTLTATTITGLDMTGSITYGTVETLNIGLGSAGDTFTITNTHAGTTNVNGNNGTDTFNIRAISGPTTVNGGNDSDTFNVGSLAPATNGLVDAIDASLTINGNDPASGSDWLYVDDTGDATPNTGTLTSTTITGLGMAVGITYGTVEHLVISLGSGNDTFTINSTHGAATARSRKTPRSTPAPATDTVHIHDVTDLLFVNGQADADTINVYGTGLGSVSTLNGDTGNDVFNVRAMNGRVNVRGGEDDDTTNVTNLAPTLPVGPAHHAHRQHRRDQRAARRGRRHRDARRPERRRFGGPGENDKVGTLTATSLTGLELEAGIDYAGLEKLNIWLGFGNNTSRSTARMPTTRPPSTRRRAPTRSRSTAPAGC